MKPHLPFTGECPAHLLHCPPGKRLNLGLTLWRRTPGRKCGHRREPHCREKEVPTRTCISQATSLEQGRCFHLHVSSGMRTVSLCPQVVTNLGVLDFSSLKAVLPTIILTSCHLSFVSSPRGGLEWGWQPVAG